MMRYLPGAAIALALGMAQAAAQDAPPPSPVMMADDLKERLAALEERRAALDAENARLEQAGEPATPESREVLRGLEREAAEAREALRLAQWRANAAAFFVKALSSAPRPADDMAAALGARALAIASMTRGNQVYRLPDFGAQTLGTARRGATVLRVGPAREPADWSLIWVDGTGFAFAPDSAFRIWATEEQGQ